MPTVRIDRRFCGPPDSGNGGYVAGLVAGALGGTDVVVTLMSPPPLDRDLALDRNGTGASLSDGDSIIAVAQRQSVEIQVPPPPSLDSAGEAEKGFAGFHAHIFPTCFVCGPDRAEGDGLRIFAGPVGDGSGTVAAVWRPDASLAGPGGPLRTEFVWAALDCPGYFAVAGHAGLAVLGRLGVTQFADRLEPRPMIVTGWPIASEGRKHFAGTALHDESGRPLAAATATWISLR